MNTEHEKRIRDFHKAIQCKDKLFESGSLLVRTWDGHEQMMMNEGTFTALVKKSNKELLTKLLKEIQPLRYDGKVNYLKLAETVNSKINSL